MSHIVYVGIASVTAATHEENVNKKLTFVKILTKKVSPPPKKISTILI